MTKKYRVVFHGPFSDEPPCEGSDVRDAAFVLARGLTLGAARRYADAVLSTGKRVIIEEEPFLPPASMKDFTACPECGLKQIKAVACKRCGFKIA